jgi:hypothetical protein
MMISTSLASEVLGVSIKAVDNLIVHAGRGSVPRGRRGSSRSIPLEVVERFALALLLRRDLGVSAVRAMQLAEQLQRGAGQATLGVIGSLHFDMTRLRSVLQQSLAAAIEGHSPRARGRPRIRQK